MGLRGASPTPQADEGCYWHLGKSGTRGGGIHPQEGDPHPSWAWLQGARLEREGRPGNAPQAVLGFQNPRRSSYSPRKEVLELGFSNSENSKHEMKKKVDLKR